MDSPLDHHASAFDRLLRPHLDRLYRLAYRLTGSKAEAEDLFQDVLVKVYRRVDELCGIREPGSWLCRIMYNHFIDNRRRFARQRLVSVDAAELPGGLDGLPGNDDPQRSAERAGDIICLERALAALSDGHRTVVLLHDVEGYKLSEIQDLTGEPLGTLKSRLHRARARLRDLLAADGTFF